jgi:hypothetical protein
VLHDEAKEAEAVTTAETKEEDDGVTAEMEAEQEDDEEKAVDKIGCAICFAE